MTWLSILVPVHDVRPYLDACIASIMNQRTDGDGVQVLMHDDASTDGSDSLAQQLVDRWPHGLRLLRGSSNRGVSVARNTLVDAADGDYLWFVDSDDKLLPNAVAALRRIVHEHKPDLILCDFQVWRAAPKLKHRLRGEQHRRTFEGPQRRLSYDRCALLTGLLRPGCLHPWSKISRRALWRGAAGYLDLEFPPGRYYEDLSTTPLLALRARSFYSEPVPWVAYRQRADSILAKPNLTKALDQSAAMRQFTDRLRTTPCWNDGAVRAALAHQAARNMIGAMRQLCCHEKAVLQDRQRFSALVGQIRQDFLYVSPLTPDELSGWYLRRGWWLRRRKFLRWFHARPLLG